MAANTSPIYTLTPIITWASVTAADADQTGVGTNALLVYTAGSNGGFIQRLIFQPISTSGSTTTNAAAGRIYLNNGSTQGTATNNTLIKEITLAATAVNTAGTSASFGYEVPLNFQLPASYTIYVGVTSFAASTAWQVCAIAGNY
jgi:hypothetical protein